MSPWKYEYKVDLQFVKDIFHKSTTDHHESIRKQDFLLGLEQVYPDVLSKRPNLRSLRQRLLLIKNVLDKNRSKSAEKLIQAHSDDRLTLDTIVQTLKLVATPSNAHEIKKPHASRWCVRTQKFRHVNYRKKMKERQAQLSRRQSITIVARAFLEAVFETASQRCVEKIWLEQCCSGINPVDVFETFPVPKTAAKTRSRSSRCLTAVTPGTRRRLTQATASRSDLNRLRVALLIPTMSSNKNLPAVLKQLMQGSPHIRRSHAFMALCEARGNLRVAERILATPGMVRLLSQASKSARERRVGRFSSWECLKAWNDLHRSNGRNMYLHSIQNYGFIEDRAEYTCIKSSSNNSTLAGSEEI